jgi:hypothetical protein
MKIRIGSAISWSGGFAVGLSLLALLAGGCGKSKSNEQAAGTVRTNAPSVATAAGQPSSRVTRFHWLGKRKIAADTNAVGLMKIWDLPESARLESQTLDKLALALGHQLPITNPPPTTTATNAPSVITNYQGFFSGATALLRPLLEDVLQSECYFELQQPTNQPWALALAVRVGDSGAALWETNLAAALQLLGGSQTIPAQKGHGWQMQLADTRALFQGILPRQTSIHGPSTLRSSATVDGQSSIIEFARAGDWTIVGLVQVPNSALPTPNSELPAHPFLPELRSRLEALAPSLPFSFWTTNNWLEAELDVAGLGPLFWAQANHLQNPPSIALSVSGDGENVRTRARLDFPKPLPYRDEQWNIPTNLISPRLASFTAVRGVAPWLASLQAWKDLSIGPPPNQFCIWALENPAQTFFAAPLADASNQVSRLADLILDKGAAFFSTNDLGGFERAQDYNGLNWAGVPFLTPFFRSLGSDRNQFFLGGLSPLVDLKGSPPVELLAQLASPTNLVCYDWELTSVRSPQWLYIGQFIRFTSQRQQIEPESASVIWLKSTAPMLGNCGTVITLSSPNQLSVVRKSTIGFTAFELHLLADWLESPEFPRGLHSLSPVPPEGAMVPPAGTGAGSTAQPAEQPKR